jgi:integrase
MPTSPRPKQPLSGCSFDTHRGKLRLRYRLRGGVQRAQATGLADTPANRRRLERTRQLVAALIRAGTDPGAVLAARFGARRTRGAPPMVPEPGGLGRTLTEYFEEWIAMRTPVIRKSQARDYRKHLTLHVLPTLGPRRLASLRPSDVLGLQVELLTRGLSVKYVKNILSGSFRALLRHARIDEVVTQDCFLGITWPKRTRPKPDPLTGEERDRLLAWFAGHRFGFHPGRSSSGRRYHHPAYHAYLHTLFWTGLRPSEASGLQQGDLDLRRGRLHVQRSRHLYEYGAPKTESADRWVELFPLTVAVLRDLQPLHVTPEMPVFTTTTGTPIEPKAFSRHWYDGLRACGIRVRGLYSTKDTYVTTALSDTTVTPAWLEQQTGVAYATLRKHYGAVMPSVVGSQLDRFAAVAPHLFSQSAGERNRYPNPALG